MIVFGWEPRTTGTGFSVGGSDKFQKTPKIIFFSSVLPPKRGKKWIHRTFFEVVRAVLGDLNRTEKNNFEVFVDLFSQTYYGTYAQSAEGGDGFGPTEGSVNKFGVSGPGASRGGKGAKKITNFAFFVLKFGTVVGKRFGTNRVFGYILGVFKGFLEHNYMFGHPGVKMRTEARWWV